MQPLDISPQIDIIPTSLTLFSQHGEQNMAIPSFIFGKTKEEFFKDIFEQNLALTYKDVTVKTDYSSVLPSQCDTSTLFSRNIQLKIPIASAAMDTITEHKIAILLALHGGIGVIHKNLSPKDQAREVDRVKFHLNGIIEKPICVNQDETMENVLKMRRKAEYPFHRFPVIDSEGKLCGILTKDHFDFCQDLRSTVAENMNVNVIHITEGQSRQDAFNRMNEHNKKAIPVINKSGEVTGLYLLSDIKRINNGESSKQTLDKKGRLRVAAAIGTGKSALERAEALSRKHVDCIVIDTAHGDSKDVYDTIKEVRGINPDIDIVAGNISEPQSAQRLAEAKVDGIKIGQGPGSTCTTRIIAGIGAPQLTAIYACHRVAQEYNIPVIADGGIKYSGDITKAIVAGADTVMLGSLFSGTDQTPGKTFTYNGQMYKTYRGMGSLEAMEENPESRKRYRQKEHSKEFIPEGVTGRTPFKGPAEKKITLYIGGLHSGMGYVGAEDIKALKEKGRFHRVTQSGQQESHPSVEISQEAPNYS